MNCLKCGAPLEEGSVSTLCPACQSLEATPKQEESPVESAPVENTPVENQVTTPAAEETPHPTQPTDESEITILPQDKPQDTEEPKSNIL